MKFKIFFNFNKIKNTVSSFLTGRSILCLFIFGLVLLGYSAFLFYYYAFKTPPPALENKTEIKTEIYKKVIERLKQREDNIQQGIVKEYPDVFR